MSFFRNWPQWLRRTFQLLALGFVIYTALGGPWRNYKVAHNHRRLVSLMWGDTWGTLYGLNEDALSLFGEPYEQSLNFLGSSWTGRVLGIDTSDPLLATSHMLRSRTLAKGMLLGLMVPLIVALLLGKIFCSHLCPMRLVFEVGEFARRGIRRFGVGLGTHRSSARFGGWIMLGGFGASLLGSVALWVWILPYVSVSLGLFLSLTTGAFQFLLLVGVFWLLVDMLVAPGYFCHNLCPTGFLLEKIGHFSLLKLRKPSPEPCPQSCRVCEDTCPYALSPKTMTKLPACDNCGRCVPACPSTRLSRRFALPLAVAILLMSSSAMAHHNKGLPHYGYFENYPQVPTEEYVAIEGRWEFGASIFNFQGMDRRTADTPNDVKLFIYLYDLKADKAYMGPVTFEIRQGDELVITLKRAKVDEESVYSTRVTLPRSGDYVLLAKLADGSSARLRFQVDLASDRVNWLVVGGIGLPVLLLFGLALFGRARRNKRRRPGSRTSGAAAVVLICLGALCASASAQVNDPAPTASPRTRKAMLDEPCALCGMLGCTAEHSTAPKGTAKKGAGVVCEHCGMVDCTMAHYQTEGGKSVMVMGGIPFWLFLCGIGGIIIFSFVAAEWLAPQAKRGFRINLIGNRRVYAMVRSRWFQAIPQLLMALIFVFLIYAGLFGSRIANITPIAVWTIWWAGLIVLVLLLGSAFCFICPWDAVSNLFSRLRLAARVDSLSLGLPFPKALANLYPAIFLFAVLTWLELGYGVTTDPRWTAYMALGMVALAIMGALLFDGKRFCAHGCPVGRICGIYGNFSPVEIRARKPKTCEYCATEDCLNGNERGYPCPTGISLKTVGAATMCTMCTECIKSCNKQNVAFNLRPFGSDLREIRQPRMDEAWLAITLLALTFFHGLSMTPAWENFKPGGNSILKWMAIHLGTPKVFNFTVGMAAAVALPAGVYWLSCRVAAKISGGDVSVRRLFMHYAYSLLPVALFYHLAHNLMHLLMEGGGIVPLLSDPLGTGADYLGTRGVHLGSLISDQAMWFLQVVLILIGHIYGIIVAHRIGHSLYQDKRKALRSLTPMLLMMILLSIGGLWLMHLDMNMRSGRM